MVGRSLVLDALPGSLAHPGGRLEFGPDGLLYATTGDGGKVALAQDPDTLYGKILRIHPDGTIPDDNPIPGSPVYSRGHRNPQGLAWQPGTLALYESEHGPWRFDEVNHIVPGGNYGWKALKCDQENSPIEILGEVRSPAVCFDQWTMGPSGMTFVDDPDSPWFGDLFLTGLRGGHLRRLRFDGDRVAESEIFFFSGGRYPGDELRNKLSLRLRDVEYRDGSLYVLGDIRGLVQITPLR